jgi:hypothetical protein
MQDYTNTLQCSSANLGWWEQQRAPPVNVDNVSILGEMTNGTHSRHQPAETTRLRRPIAGIPLRECTFALHPGSVSFLGG